MEINTNHLGKIVFEKENVIFFEEGLPGFEREKEFVIVLSNEADLPFHYLQSINTPDVSFMITNPFIFVSSYDFELPLDAVDALGVEEATDVSIYSITTIPEDLEKTSINLTAPVVVNNKNNKGKQVVLVDYPFLKYYIFSPDGKGDA